MKKLQAGLLMLLLLFFAAPSFAAPGDLDVRWFGTFGTGGVVITDIGTDTKTDEAKSIIQLADGKLLAAGYSFDGTYNHFALSRYNTDGTLDTTFNATGTVVTPIGILNGSGNALLEQSDGMIVVAGSVIIDGVSEFALARYDTLGVLDPLFGTDGIVTTNIGGSDSAAMALVQQADGKLVAAGYVNSDGTVDFDFALVRYNTDGSLDSDADIDTSIHFGFDGIVTTAFGTDSDQAHALVLQTDGKLVAAGSSVAGTYNFALARYNTDGTLDASFGTGGKVSTLTGTMDIATDLLLSGNTLWAAGKIGPNLALRYYSSVGGLSNTTLGGLADQNDVSVVRLSGSKYLLAGTDGTTSILERYTSGGSLDTTFGTNGRVASVTGTTNDLLEQANGEYVTAGQSSDGFFGLERYHAGIKASFAIDNRDVTFSNAFTSAIHENVTLNLCWSNYTMPCSQMQFSDDNTAWSTWQAYSSSVPYTLPGLDGPKTVYVKFKDSEGDTSSTYSQSITMLPVPPAPPMLFGPQASTQETIQTSWFLPRTSWFEPLLNGTTYDVQMSADDGANWTNKYNPYNTGADAYYNNQATLSGNYKFRVRTRAPGFSPSFWTTSDTCPVTLTVAKIGKIFLPATDNDGKIQISWFKSYSGDVEYVLDRSVDAGATWESIEVYRGTKAYFNDLGLGPQTYTYRVHGEKPGYVASGYTQSSPCVGTRSDATPAWISIPAGSLTGSFTVSWDASSIPAAEYLLEYSIDNGNSWQVETQYTVNTDTSASVTLVNGTYKYRVQAYKPDYSPTNWVESNGSTQVSLNVVEPPGSLSVPANNTTGQYTISWASSTTPDVIYELEESIGGGPFINVYTGPNSAFSLSGQTEETYSYRVKATYGANPDSAFVDGVNSCSVIPTSDAPLRLNVPADDGTGYFWIYWPAVATPAATYELEYRFDDGGGWSVWEPIPEYTPSSQTRIRVHVTQPGIADFRVRSLAGGFYNSDWTSGTLPYLSAAAPGEIFVQSASATGNYQVSWFKSATPGVAYQLDESDDNGQSWTPTYNGYDAAYNVTNKLDGTYRYRVAASLLSSYAISAPVISGPCVVELIVAPPARIFVSNITSRALQVSWFKSSFHPTTFEVMVGFNGGPMQNEDGYTETSNAYFNTAALAAGEYEYLVRALKTDFQPSNWISTGIINIQ